MTINYLKRMAELYGVKNINRLYYVNLFLKFLESKAPQGKSKQQSSEQYDMRGLE